MRTDENLARDSFRLSDSWRQDAAQAQSGAQPSIDERLEGFEVREDGKVVVHSLSGKERNRLFLNHGGKEFENASTISGLDNPADSRGWVLLDYDRDGWQDVAVVNANAPLMNLYHNDIGQVQDAASSGMIALRFVGGGGAGFACRDGYGAIVEVALSNGTKIKREHRCGEGYSSQNSSTMVIGIGAGKVDAVTVRWPSGKVSTAKQVAEGTLLTAFENRPASAFTQQPYRSERSGAAPVAAAKTKFPVSRAGAGRVQIYTTTATWCAACLGHLPALAQLKQDGIELYGVPIDPNDGAAKLADYVDQKNPPYQMLAEIGAYEKQRVQDFLAKRLQVQNPVLPSSVITDARGNVLEVMQGIPTLSQVRKWMQSSP